MLSQHACYWVFLGNWENCTRFWSVMRRSGIKGETK
jgi:hypothetical protein